MSELHTLVLKHFEMVINKKWEGNFIELWHLFNCYKTVITDTFD